MKYIIALVCLCYSIQIHAQSIGIGTDTPHPSAALDVSSDKSGLLIPRVDTTMILTPSPGLMVFQPSDSGFYFFTGMMWQKLGTVALPSDQDGDTKIEVERFPDEDKLVFTAGGVESLIIEDGRLDMPSTQSNVILGHDAGADQTGINNVLVGKDAGRNVSGGNNVMVGNQAGNLNTSGYQNTFIGDQAGLKNDEGFTNVYVGKDAGYENTNGNNNVGVGFGAGRQGGSSNTSFGFAAGYSNAGKQNVFLGKNAGQGNDNGDQNVFVGYEAGQYNDGKQNTFIGSRSGQIAEDSLSIFIGTQAGYTSDGSRNIFMGTNAGYSNKGDRNIFIGGSAGQSATNSDNIFMGQQAGWRSTNGYRSVIIGNDAASLDTLSRLNVIIGYQAGEGGPNNSFLHGKQSNTIIGERAGHGIQGNDNTIIGSRAGQLATGAGHVLIGKDAGTYANGDNKLYIDNSDTSTPLIYGNLAEDSVIVNGVFNINNEYSLPINDGSNNQVLSTDGNGNTSWKSAPEDDDWNMGSNGFYNLNDRFAIGVINPSFTRRFAVHSTDDPQTAYFQNSGNNGSTVTQGIYGYNANSGSGDKHGVRGYASSQGTGSKYGVHGTAYSTASAPGFGGYFASNFTDGTGIFAEGTKLAAEFEGDTYTNGEVGIGIEAPIYNLHLEKSSGNFNTQEVHIGMTNSETGSTVNDGFEISYLPVQNGIIEESHARLWNHEPNGEIRFGTSNTQRMVIDASGQIGIGTSSVVDSKIHIHKTSNNGIPAKIRFTDNITGVGTSNSVEGFEVGLGANQQGVILHTDPKDIEFYTNNLTNIFTLKTNGDAQMGLSGESDQFRMDNGSIRLINLGNSDDNDGFKWGEGDTDAFGFVYDGEGSENSNRLHLREYIGTTNDIITIEAGGDIGINNVNPGFDLHMGSNSAAKPSSSSWSVTSDARSKDVLGNFSAGLETIMTINPVKFRYNGSFGITAGLEGIGTVAQDLQETAPYMVNTTIYEDEKGNTEEYLTVDYGAMDFVLINAIKDLKVLMESQAERIRTLESEVENLKK